MDQMNPFTNRAMIQEPEDFFGRVEELRDLYQRIAQNQSVSLVGERRVGKSSILSALGFERQSFRIDDALRFVYLDMQSLSGRTEAMIVERLLDLIEDETGIRAGSSLLDLDPTVKMAAARGMRLIILLDEFNSLTENTNVSPFFYDRLRSISTAYRVTFVTAYREGTVETLVASLKEQKNGLSPFMNQFGVIYIGPLQPRDADELILKQGHDGGIEFSGTDVKLIQSLGGRLPFFLQIAAYHAFEAKRWGSLEQSWSKIEDGFRVEVLHHFHSLWGRLPKAEQTLLWTMQAGAHSGLARAVRERALKELHKKGILVESDGDSRLFSPVFEEVIDETSLEAEGLRGSR